jgi:hypothetical protein
MNVLPMVAPLSSDARKPRAPYFPAPPSGLEKLRFAPALVAGVEKTEPATVPEPVVEPVPKNESVAEPVGDAGKRPTPGGEKKRAKRNNKGKDPEGSDEADYDDSYGSDDYADYSEDGMDYDEDEEDNEGDDENEEQHDTEQDDAGAASDTIIVRLGESKSKPPEKRAPNIATEEDLGSLGYRALQAACKAQGLTASGKSDVLRERLRKHLFS